MVTVIDELLEIARWLYAEVCKHQRSHHYVTDRHRLSRVEARIIALSAEHRTIDEGSNDSVNDPA